MIDGLEKRTYPVDRTRRAHLNWIDSLRAIAAIWVLLYHVNLTLPLAMVGWSAPPILWILRNGHFGVTAFISISGFSLGLPLPANGWRFPSGVLGFYQRRAIRILPPYYCGLVFSLVLIWTVVGHKTGTHWDISIPVSRRDVLNHILLLPPYFMTASINHAYWSIAIESHIYLVFPLIVLAVRKWQVWGGISAVLAFVAISYPARNYELFMPQFILVFGFGLGAAALVVRKIEAPLYAWVGVLGAILLLYYFGDEQDGTALRDLSIGLAVCVVMYLAGTEQIVAKGLSAWPLPGIGRFAYSIYLVHAPLIQVAFQSKLWMRGASESIQFGLLCLESLSLTLPCAHGFYLIFERPFVLMRPMADRSKI